MNEFKSSFPRAMANGYTEIIDVGFGGQRSRQENPLSGTNCVSLSFVNKSHSTRQFPHTGVRKGAVMALGQFCSGFHSLLQEAGAEDKTACK